IFLYLDKSKGKVVYFCMYTLHFCMYTLYFFIYTLHFCMYNLNNITAQPQKNREIKRLYFFKIHFFLLF
ncbi:hypothetical protein ACMBCN_02850, partial [Candidatus Liberibacter asiaticus]